MLNLLQDLLLLAAPAFVPAAGPAFVLAFVPAAEQSLIVVLRLLIVILHWLLCYFFFWLLFCLLQSLPLSFYLFPALLAATFFAYQQPAFSIVSLRTSSYFPAVTISLSFPIFKETLIFSFSITLLIDIFAFLISCCKFFLISFCRNLNRSIFFQISHFMRMRDHFSMHVSNVMPSNCIAAI